MRHDEIARSFVGRGGRALVALGFLIVTVAPAWPEVVLDRSFSRDGPVGGTPKLITPAMGRQVRGNIFHSFRTCDLPAGDRAICSGQNDVQHVSSGVTGGKGSACGGDSTVSIPGGN